MLYIAMSDEIFRFLQSAYLSHCLNKDAKSFRTNLISSKSVLFEPSYLDQKLKYYLIFSAVLHPIRERGPLRAFNSVLFCSKSQRKNSSCNRFKLITQWIDSLMCSYLVHQDSLITQLFV